MRAAVVPDWLAEVVRPQPAPVPWPGMIRAVLAVCVPLSVAFAAGKGTLGVLPATGGLHGTMVDTGGSYLNRVKRVSSAAVFGGAAGLAIGSVIHGQGWLAVLALVVVAGASGVLGALGDIGSATGMQLLVYAALGTGPLGALRPVWHTVVGFVAGVVWALILDPARLAAVPVRRGTARRRRRVPGAGHGAALGRQQRVRQPAAGPDRRARHRLRHAVAAPGPPPPARNRHGTRLVAALNASVLLEEAATALGVAGTRPPSLIIATVERLADSIRNGTPPPVIPPPWDDGPGALALHDAMAGVGAGAVQRVGAGASHPRRNGCRLQTWPGLPDSRRPRHWTGWWRRSAAGRSPGCSRCG